MDKSNYFAKKHQIINLLIGILMILIIVGFFILILYFFTNKTIEFIVWIAGALSKVDAVIVVALITGAVSIVGVVISSIVGKSLEYKKSRNEYLAQKREKPYGEFVEMVYKVQANIKTPNSYTQEEMISDLSKFSKQLTLWGSPRVAKKWKEFRYNGSDPNKATENLFVMEGILNEMRKDLGVKKMKKGGLLSFFVNDIDDYK